MCFLTACFFLLLLASVSSVSEVEAVKSWERVADLGFFVEGEEVKILLPKKATSLDLYIGTSEPTPESIRTKTAEIAASISTLRTFEFWESEKSDPLIQASEAMSYDLSRDLKDLGGCFANIYAFGLTGEATYSSTHACNVSLDDMPSLASLTAVHTDIVELTKRVKRMGFPLKAEKQQGSRRRRETSQPGDNQSEEDSSENSTTEAAAASNPDSLTLSGATFQISETLKAATRRAGAQLAQCFVRLGAINQLANGEVPGLAHAAITAAGCFSAGQIRKILVKTCNTVTGGFHCELLSSTKKQLKTVKKVFAVPHCRTSKTITLDLGRQVPFVETGLPSLGDLGKCTRVGGIYRCPPLHTLQVNSCLQSLLGGDQDFLKHCAFKINPMDGAPLVQRIGKSSLLVARMCSSLNIRAYIAGDPVYADDPILISSNQEVSLRTGGDSKILFVGKALKNIVHASKINASVLSAILENNGEGNSEIENFLPDSVEEVIMVVSIVLQLLLFFPCCIAAKRGMGRRRQSNSPDLERGNGSQSVPLRERGQERQRQQQPKQRQQQPKQQKRRKVERAKEGNYENSQLSQPLMPAAAVPPASVPEEEALSMRIDNFHRTREESKVNPVGDPQDAGYEVVRT